MRERLECLGGLLECLERERRALGDQVGDLAGAGHEPVPGHDLAHQAPRHGLLGAKPFAGKQHVHVDVIGDAPEQHLYRPAIGQEAPLHLGQKELGIVRRDDQVAAQPPPTA